MVVTVYPAAGSVMDLWTVPLEMTKPIAVMTCSEGYYKCEGLNTICIMEHWICNGFLDCPRGEDELYCVTGSAECDPEQQFTCNDGRCINEQFRCDGLLDCFRGEDEEQCSSCKEGYRCTDYSCIPDMYICDGQEECTGGEDELICVIVMKVKTN
ncbi:hypothetical protein Pcinc_015627 [Petrolisthes cinctipes]|uniref:Uncharacterized protein n=1 Tax=Petrolisthes cinctipes TaxID=88211 RepID=A0AAE1FSM3_PETCI|nr:hypothetical protein Pcinc_015627 [Petrolisthes cinctipes]